MEKTSSSNDLKNQDYYIDKSIFSIYASNYSGEDMPDGMDYQGIRWKICMSHTTRKFFRERRNGLYMPHRQFKNLSGNKHPLKNIRQDEPYYTFEKFYKVPDLWLGHFQLKHNILLPTKNDIIYPIASGFIHYSLLTFEKKKFTIDTDLNPVGIDYEENIVALPTVDGNLVLYDLQKDQLISKNRVMSHNEINNCAVFLKRKSSKNSMKIACGGNDSTLRIFDLQDCLRTIMKIEMNDPVNYIRQSVNNPDLLLLLSDKKEADIFDMRARGIVMKLEGHQDYGFSGDWHPDGNYMATGNQDTTCRIWDLRNPHEAVNILQSQLESSNSVRYSPNGSYLAVGENADFVNIYNVDKNYEDMQVIDFFGDVTGLNFDAEDGDNLMIGVLLEGRNGIFEYNIRRVEHINTLWNSMF